MTSLSNLSPAATYQDLLQINSNGLGLQNNPLQVQDGLGNDTIMSVWTAGVNFDRAMGQFQLDGVALTATANVLNNLVDVAVAPYLLMAPDAQLPNSAVLTGATGINLVAAGPNMIITPASELGGVQSLLGLGALGFVARTAAGTYRARTLTTDGTLTITNPAGTAADPQLVVNPDSVIQKVQVELNGILTSTRQTLNFVVGANAGIAVVDNAGANRTDVTISGVAALVTTITGTANQIVASAPSGAVTLSLATDVIITTSVAAGNMKMIANTLQSTDANGNINISPNGTGAVQVGTGGQQTQLRIMDSAGVFYSGFRAAALAASTTWTLPTADSAGTQCLASDGAGTLSWANFAGGVTTITGTVNQIIASAAVGAITLSMPNDVIITTSVAAGNMRLIGNTLQATNAGGDVIIAPNAAGTVQIKNSTNAIPLQFYNAAGTQYVAFQAGVLAGNTTWTLPVADAVGVQALVSNGAGVLSWASIAGGVTSLAGTANQIDVSAATGAVTISMSATYVGQASITTLGTITTGVWNGSLVPLAYGGTNANLVASNGGIFYSTATSAAILAGTSTANQVLLSGNLGMPGWSTATYPGATTANQILYSSANNVIAGLPTANSGVLKTDGTGIPSIGTATVDVGGTGVQTFTAYAVICGGTTGTGNLQSVASVGTAGQVLTSNGAGALPTFQNAAGGSWVDQTATPVTVAAGTRYIANTAGLLTFNVPGVAAQGFEFEIAGLGAGGWIVQFAGGQTGNLNSSATSVAGSFASTNRYNSIKIVCVTANTTFTVISSSGSITVA